MKIINPNFPDTVTAFVQANKGAISAWLAQPAQAALRDVSADDIRAAFPLLAAKLTDGTIAEICKALNITVTS